MERLKVLILGGTGLISTGITDAALAIGHEVIHFNRGQRGQDSRVETFIGDRHNLRDLEKAAELQCDVVIDMLGFNAQHAKMAVEAFKGKIKQFIFCSTCCVYRIVDTALPPTEDAPTDCHTEYGANKFAAEEVMREAQREGAFQVTIFRPSHVYGGNFFINQLDFDGFTFLKQLKAGKPVLLGDSGLTVRQACHRTDAGKAFAYAAGREKCYGKTYNLSYQEIMSWRMFYEKAAQALGVEAQLVTLPASAIVNAGGDRLGYFRDYSRFNTAINVDLLYQDIPEFSQTISFLEGVRQAYQEAIGQNPELSVAYDELLNDLLRQAKPLLPIPQPYGQ